MIYYKTSAINARILCSYMAYDLKYYIIVCLCWNFGLSKKCILIVVTFALKLKYGTIKRGKSVLCIIHAIIRFPKSFVIFKLKVHLMKQLYLSLPKIIKIINAIYVFKHCVSFSALQLSQLTPVTPTLLIMHSDKIIKDTKDFW